MAMEAQPLRDVRRAAQLHAKWLDERDRRIVACHEAGFSLRDIAAAAGLTHPGVLSIIRRRAGDS